MKYFFIGIKGAGCCALSNILLDLGEEVFGCDVDQNFYTDAFLDRVRILRFEDVKLRDDCFYIIGNAFVNHPLALQIIENHYPYSYYPEFIENYFQMPKIGVAGSHGKSSTTAFLTQMVDIKVNSLVGDGSGLGDKEAKYLIFEACEYRRNFLNYHYEYLIILNIDYDHPDYFRNREDYIKCFQEVVYNTKCLICNYDDENCRQLNHGNKITFGFENGADMIIDIDEKLTLKYQNRCYQFDVPFKSKGYCYDFAAAFLTALLISENVALLCENSKDIIFPKRRLNLYFDTKKNNVYVDDYAHHPQEIKNVINELKARFSNYKIIVIFQPHTYSRSYAFYDDFIKSLSTADEVYILPTFASVREGKQSLDPLFGFSPYDMNVRKKLLLMKNSVISFLGAGDICDEMNFYL